MANIVKQGSEYDPPNEYETPDSGVDEMTKSFTYSGSSFGIDDVKNWILDNKLKTALIACGVIAVILILILVAMFSGGKTEEIVEEPPEIIYEPPPEPTPPPFRYSDGIYDRMRSAGYTASEIEKYEGNKADPEALINKAHDLRKEEALDRYHSLLRNTSESTDLQYAYVMGNSYLGLTPQDINMEDHRRDVAVYKENVDYWKMPLQGYQPLIKIRLKDGEILYMYISPDRYVALSDSGNIRIQYDRYLMYGCDMIINIKEIE